MVLLLGIFLRHYKKDSKILLSFTFFLGKNTQLCLQSIVCYIFEGIFTKYN